LPHYSLLVTSCDRFDLLKQTLDSFIGCQCGGVKPRECIIVDDSAEPMPGWLSDNIHFYSSNLGTVRWVSNGGRRGQIYTADRLWSLCTNDFAFWMEDDWTFNQGHWMQDSFDILEQHPKVITVSLRGDTGWHQLIDLPPFPFKIAMPGWRGGWGGWTFNCGVRRKSDYLKLGSYGRHVSYGTGGLFGEKELSKKLLAEGFRIADLNRPIAVHIGGARSRAGEPPPAPPKILIGIPVCHRFSYGKWESGDSPSFDQATAYNGQAYGTGIHISGENDRIAAMRDTWLKDVAAFPNVTYKLFYGSPSPTGFILKPDEVLLGVPDDYGSLPAKTIAICKYAEEHRFDLLYKCDDDTGVYVDRIIREAMTGIWDYAGYLNGRVATGGTGYWLTKRAISIIANQASANNHWAEDVTVSKCLFSHNIQPVHLEGHRTGSADHWFWKDGFDPAVDMTGISAFHAVKPADMRAWYAARS
jgi:hypothetical protein